MAQSGVESRSRNLIDWTQIDEILLDLDGTLLDLNFDLHFWLEYLPIIYSEKHKIRIEDAKNTLLKMLDAKIVRASNKYKQDSYDDALAYLIEAENLHKPIFEIKEKK